MPPTYISHLHAQNISLFKEANIEFDPRLNIIIGTNGAGKTTLLRLIAFAFSHVNYNAVRFRRDSNFNVIYCANDKRYISGLTNVVSEDQQFRKFQASGWMKWGKENFEESYYPQDNKAYNLFAIGAYRQLSYQRIDGMKKELRGYERRLTYEHANNIQFDSPKLPDVKQWLINRYFIVDKSWADNEDKNLRRLVELLPELSPKNAIIRFNKIERDLEPSFYLNENECYLEELSSGFKSFLSIVFSIIDWIEGVNDNDQMLIENAQGTVLIDEIDAHLHPQWQSQILKSLRRLFPQIQFIVTTHSPLVLASAESHQVIKIPQHNGIIDLKPLPRDFKGWNVEYILTDLMDAVVEEDKSVLTLIKAIEDAYKDKDLEKYDAALSQLKNVLNKRDSILNLYSIKRSSLFLENDDNSNKTT